MEERKVLFGLIQEALNKKKGHTSVAFVYYCKPFVGVNRTIPICKPRDSFEDDNLTLLQSMLIFSLLGICE
jgi:hypothetical protein